MEDMATDAPCNAEAWMIWISSWVGLVFNARLVQIVSANGAGVCADGPGPHGHSIPFLDLEALGRLAPALFLSSWTLLWLLLYIKVHSFWFRHTEICSTNRFRLAEMRKQQSTSFNQTIRSTPAKETYPGSARKFKRLQVSRDLNDSTGSQKRIHLF